MHPHGILYSKDNEGADSGAGARISPNGSYDYTWTIDEAVDPRPNDPSTIMWLYHSHFMSKEEVNLGLVGTLIITRKGMEA